MNFRELLESGVTLDIALKILELEYGYSLEELKKAYRKKSRIYHPDLGGSTEDMQKLNSSFELLKMELNSNRPSKYNNADDLKFAKNINSIIKDNLDFSKFTDYFKDIFNKEFYITNVKYHGEDSKSYYINYAGINFRIESKDGEFVIDFKSYVNINNIKGSLGSNPGVPLEISSEGYFSSRKFKLFNKTWDNIKINSFDLNNPQMFFPKSKLIKHTNKKETTKATKKDFVSLITKILKGETLSDSNSFAIHLKDDIYMVISRGTIMGTGTYNITINKKVGYRYPETDSSINRHYTWFETPELLDMIASFKDKNQNEIEKIFIKEKDRLDSLRKNS